MKRTSPLQSIRSSLTHGAKIALVLACVLSASLYIIQISSNVVLKDQIHAKQAQLEELAAENEDLITEALESTSLGHIEERALELGFTRIDRVQYVNVTDTQIARE